MKGRVAVVGAAHRVEGFSYAGAVVVEAADAEAARRVVRDLPEDVTVVIMTPDVAKAAGEFIHESRRDRIWTVMAT